MDAGVGKLNQEPWVVYVGKVPDCYVVAPAPLTDQKAL